MRAGSVRAHPNNPCLGYRPVVCGSAKPYEWLTYQQACLLTGCACSHAVQLLRNLLSLLMSVYLPSAVLLLWSSQAAKILRKETGLRTRHAHASELPMHAAERFGWNITITHEGKLVDALSLARRWAHCI